MKRNIIFKFTLPAALMIFLVIGIISVILIYTSVNEIKANAKTESENKISEINNLLDNEYDNLIHRVKSTLKYFKKMSDDKGLISIGAETSIAGKAVPALLFGNASQVNNYEIVDMLSEFAGGNNTLFVKKGEDFIRISTNVKKNGNRAVGTLLDKTTNAYKSIIKGESFYGMVDLLGEKYITGYEPIIVNNIIVGARFTGYKVDGLIKIGENIKNSHILTSGFIALVDKGKPIFYSNCTNAEFATKCAKEDVESWNISKSQASQTKLQIICAYPQKDVNAKIYSQLYLIGIVSIIGILLLIVVLTYLLKFRIVKPISMLQIAAENIANGNLNNTFNFKSDDEIGALSNSFSKMSDTINLLINETSILTNATGSGKLNVRGDDAKFSGAYRMLVQGINSTVDSLTTPLNVAANYINRISKGDIPPKITDKYDGDFNEIINNLNTCIDTLSLLLLEMNTMSNEHDLGNIDVEIDISQFTGAYSQMAAGVNKMVNSHLNVNKSAIGVFEEFGKGKFDADIAILPGKKVFINNAINAVRVNLKNIESEILTLISATKAGKLDTRANLTSFTGGWALLAGGVNELIEAFVAPIKATSIYVGKISKGDIPGKITETYNGDFNEIKSGINQLIDSTNEVTNAAKQIAAGDVKISLRKRSENDEMIEGVISIAQSIEQVVEGVNEYIYYIKAGEIEKINFDTELFLGAYKDIFSGLNQAAIETVTPLLEILTVMKNLEQGDLTLLMTGDYRGGFAMLKDAANNSITSFNDLLSQVSVTVEEVTKGSLQVSDASTALSQGATEQAASLEEITSSMSEVGSQVRENAQNANQANLLTNEAKEAAEKGDKEMNQLNKAMEEISESSKNISKIIRVIDEIAFQTNLLALNAAVEAARAGRHGKGFAVVAEEVRNLAARSASAARETSSMIEDSIKSVETGGLLAHRTSEALEEIKSGSIKAADIVAEIAALSSEQAQAIAQINEGLNQIDKVTQTNTASAEESASASEELSGQAGQLKIMLSKFKLNNSVSNFHAELSGGLNSKNLIADNQYKPRKRALPNKRTQVTSPEDFISLDEDDFDRY